MWAECVEAIFKENREENEPHIAHEEIEKRPVVLPNTTEHNSSTTTLDSLTVTTEYLKGHRVPPIWMRDYWMRDYVTGEWIFDKEAKMTMYVATNSDPIHFADSMRGEKWRRAMDTEIDANNKNGIWGLMELPVGGTKFGIKWVYKTNFDENREINKHKARLFGEGIC